MIMVSIMLSIILVTHDHSLLGVLIADLTRTAEFNTLEKRSQEVIDSVFRAPVQQNHEFAPPLPIQKISDEYIKAQRNAYGQGGNLTHLSRRAPAYCGINLPCADGRLEKNHLTSASHVTDSVA